MRIPREVARESAMMSPAFRFDLARLSDASAGPIRVRSFEICARTLRTGAKQLIRGKLIVWQFADVSAADGVITGDNGRPLGLPATIPSITPLSIGTPLLASRK
jgi:hypothetical protein